MFIGSFISSSLLVTCLYGLVNGKGDSEITFEEAHNRMDCIMAREVDCGPVPLGMAVNILYEAWQEQDWFPSEEQLENMALDDV